MTNVATSPFGLVGDNPFGLPKPTVPRPLDGLNKEEEDQPTTVPSMFFPEMDVRSRGIPLSQMGAMKGAMTELQNTSRELVEAGYQTELTDALEGNDSILDIGRGAGNELFDFLQIGNFTIAGTVSELLMHGSPSAALRRAGVEFSHALPTSFLENIGLDIVGALDPEKTIEEIKAMPVMEATWADVLRGKGVTDERLQEIGESGSFGDMIKSMIDTSRDSPTTTAAVGWILDIALDPTTYFGYGVAKALKPLKHVDGFIGRALPGTAESISQYVKQSNAGYKFRKMFMPGSLLKGLSEGENAQEIADAFNAFNGLKEGSAGFITREMVMEDGANVVSQLITKTRNENLWMQNVKDTVYNIAGSLPEEQLAIIQLYAEQPKALESIIPHLGLSKAGQDNIREATKAIRGVLDEWQEAEKNLGILSEGQSRSNYMFGMLAESPHSQKVIEETIRARYGEEAGEIIADRIKHYSKVTVNSGPRDGMMRKATFEYQASYKNTAHRTMAAVPIELNAGVTTIMRGFDSARRRATQLFYDSTLKDSSVSMIVDADIYHASKNLATASTEARAKVKLLKDAGMDILELGAPDLADKTYFAMPKAMVETFQKANKVFADPEETGDFFHFIRELTDTWKVWALMSPGYHARNLMSGGFSNWISGMNITDPDTYRSYYEAMLTVFRDTKNMPRALRAKAENFFGGNKSLDDMKFVSGNGQTITGKEMYDEISSAGIRGGGLYGVDAGNEFQEIQRVIGDVKASEKISISNLDGWGDPFFRIERVASQFRNMYKSAGAEALSNDNYKSMAELYDSVARAWAFRNGKTPADWYRDKVVFNKALRDFPNEKTLRHFTEGKGGASAVIEDIPLKNVNGALDSGKVLIGLTHNADKETLAGALGYVVRKLMLDDADQLTISRWLLGEKKVTGAIAKQARKLKKNAANLTNAERLEAINPLWDHKAERNFAHSFSNFLARGTEGLNVNNAMESTFERIRESLNDLYHFSAPDMADSGIAMAVRGGDAWKTIRRMIGEGVDENPEQLLTAKAVIEGVAKAGKRNRHLPKFMGGDQTLRNNSLVDFNREVGRNIEYFMRAAHYIFKRKKGFTPTQADASVKAFHFDYNELTEFERKTMKTILPFYTWVRKNTPLMLTEMAKQPQRFARIPKTFEAIEAMSPELDGIATPDYFDEINAVRLPWDSGIMDSDSEGLPMYVALDLPYQDLNRINLRDWLSSISPFLRLPIELLGPQGHTIFSDRPIEKFSGEPGMIGDKKLDYAIESLAPPISRYVMRPIKKAQEGKLGEELIRTALGIGVRSSDPDRNVAASIFKKRAAVRAAKQRIMAKLNLKNK